MFRASGGPSIGTSHGTELFTAQFECDPISKTAGRQTTGVGYKRPVFISSAR